MGGTSTSSQTQTSQSSPWSAATPALNGILSGINSLIPQAGASAAAKGAQNTLLSNYSAGNPYAPAVGNVATGLLGGGGANANDGGINANLTTYRGQLTPLVSNTNYNPYTTPGFADALKTSDADITNAINGRWAGAGRDLSPGNAQALARGLAQGNSQAIFGQYNANVQNQQNAANSLFGAGNTTYGLLNNTQATANANRQAGVGAASAALDANNWGPNGILTTESNAFSLPASQYQTLLGSVLPAAQAFGTSTGSGTASQTMSPVQQFATLGQGAANWGKFLFGGA